MLSRSTLQIRATQQFQDDGYFSPGGLPARARQRPRFRGLLSRPSGSFRSPGIGSSCSGHAFSPSEHFLYRMFPTSCPKKFQAGRPHRLPLGSGKFANGHRSVSKPRNRLKTSQSGSEAVASPGCINQLAVLIVANDERVEILGRRCVPSDNKFLAAVDSHLQPDTRSLTRFITAVQTRRNQTLEALRLHGTDQIIETRVQLQ